MKLLIKRMLALVVCLFAAQSGTAAESPFPLKITQNQRYLVDAAGHPFLYHADTAWMMFLGLTMAEANEYLTTRKAQGFNAIQVMLTGFLGATNRAGVLPFHGQNDLVQPNERYFSHVDDIIELAGKHQMLLAVAPLWAGCCGEGWSGQNKDRSLKPMNLAGPNVCRTFGVWLGHRYARHKHLLWILGGDNDPGESREHIRQLALGLKESAPHQLCTYHAASTHSSTDVWPGESWIEMPMVYTYFRGFNKAWNKNQPDVYEVGYKEYSKRPVRPFFLGESTYEGEHGDWGSPRQVRKQAYWAMLSGATGHAYGSPNWRCEKGWREGLQRPGALSLQHFYRFFTAMQWWKLIPDEKNELAVSGRGPYGTNDYATTALAADRLFAVTYLPSPRSVSINLERMGGPRVKTEWFNPRSGQISDNGIVAAKGQHSFAPPTNDPEDDWVLVLKNANR